MKPFEKIFTYILSFIALLAALLALSPNQWKANFAAWSRITLLSHVDWFLVFLLCVGVFLFLLQNRSKTQLTFWTTRKKWWDKNLSKIIDKSEKFVVVDSFQGTKHEFWNALEKRLAKKNHFI